MTRITVRRPLLETIDAYRFTVPSTLAAVQRVLAGGISPGFLTPSKAFGAEFAMEVSGTKIHWITTRNPSTRTLLLQFDLPPTAPPLL